MSSLPPLCILRDTKIINMWEIQSLNSPRPTRIEFERQLRRLQNDVLRMGALVENSCWLSRQALCDRDLDAAQQLPLQDKQIDRMYRQIELDCINLMALQSPVTQDLRLLSALMQLVRDLERIGDYAENIGDIAIKLFPYALPSCMDQVQVMLDRCRAMLAMGLASLANLDAESGLGLKVKDDAVDSDYESLYNQLACQSDVKGSIEPIVLLVLVIRHLERMADHSTNIGKRVAYIVTGQR
jgi:phosphate transport system protein